MKNKETSKINDDLHKKIIQEVGLQTHLKGSQTLTFAQMLSTFAQIEFSEEEALDHWCKILQNLHELRECLGRKVSVHTAITDYFTTCTPFFKNPLLVDYNQFKDTVEFAMIDGLTGVFNRRYMDIILRKEYNRCDRYKKSLSVCLLDIDDFKKINDSLGHSFGDQVLRELSHLLKEALREEDIVCRFGGEEFLLILPETNDTGAYILAERIRKMTEKIKFFKDYRITFSAGIAAYPESARDFDDLIDSADRALYQAKYNGKNKVLTAIPERRRHGRIPRSWSVEICNEKTKAPISGISTHNVSLGGVQFECPVNYTVDTPLHLVFHNSNTTIPGIEAEGRITWVKRKLSSYQYGVSFSETPEKIEKRLSALDVHVASAM